MTDAAFRRNPELIPRLFVGLGVAFLFTFAGEWLFIFTGPLDRFLSADFAVSFAITVPFCAGLMYGGYALERGALDADRYPRVGKWLSAGLLGFLAVNVPIMVMWGPTDSSFLVGWTRWAASVGANFGLFIGIVEARAIERERAAERAAVRAEEAEARQEWLDYMNSLLRHELLNTATVIEGYAAVLEEEYAADPQAVEYLATIRRQSRSMTSVIRDVRVLLKATGDDARREPTNVGDVVTEELENLRDASGDVESSVAEDAYAAADDLLHRVFSNLFSNAVEHGSTNLRSQAREDAVEHGSTSPRSRAREDAAERDGATVRLDVTVETTPDTVVVRVSDDGPGIPEDELATLFERSDTSDDHGLGLYLVKTLVDRYEGSIELRDTGPEGTTFVVELPRVPAPGVASPSESDDSASEVRPDTARPGPRAAER
ncbi:MULTISPECIES: sensor histidine kinase [Halorussus]|uniref:sensor histidine kinase n=1 Tax=Halorussus TaxID=1070314 RepID=UPI0020A016A5|nr:HAMP domain-containing sensor histidine kinase [Halorussus vallis]USZ75060.1 HAMP domain-containing histidine kinase [Halorussus vallis]